MKLQIDLDANTLLKEDGCLTKAVPLYSNEGFRILSDIWSKVAWNQKYTYTFTWMGVPAIQLPEDMIRLQEVLWRVQPDVIIECGVAHGGGAVFYASLCKASGRGRVIGIDVEYRGDHRQKIERHVLAPFITLIEGSSTNPGVVARAKGMIRPGETVMVILDSNHSRQHVTDELNAYHDVVTLGSYIVATDGSMECLHDVPRGKPEWKSDNPAAAAREFAASHPEFVIETIKPVFNESTLETTLTHWPDAWLKRIA